MLLKRLFFCLVICTCIVVNSSIAYCDTYISGNITSDTTWTNSNSPYIVTATVHVLSGVTVTIEPGVTIKFNINTGLNIDGKLVARGTDSQKILFTSNQLFPAPGDWGGIAFLDGSIDATVDDSENYLSGSIIEYSVVEYGGNDSSYIGGAIQCINSSPYISNTIVHNNSAGQNNGGGIYLLSSDAYILHNEIYNNSAGRGGGLYIKWDSAPLIKENSITHNNATWNGGGIGIIDSTPKILENKIRYNTVTVSGYGGGICTIRSQSIILSNYIELNSAYYGGGIFSQGYPGSIIRQNKVAMNTGIAGGGISIVESLPDVNNNIITDNADYDFYILWDGINSSPDVDASRNYWGTTDTTIIDSVIYDYYDNVLVGKAICNPYLTSAPPMLIDSISLKSDNTYTLPFIPPVKIDDSLFIQMEGIDGNPLEADATSVSVKSNITDTKGISIVLHETDINSGIYRGAVRVEFSSNDATDIIGTSGNEILTIASDVDNTKTISIDVEPFLNLYVIKSGTGNGSVRSSPVGIDCGSDCTGAYANETTVTLTAIADESSTFSDWSGCDSRSGNTCAVAMDNNKTVTANFSQISYTLNLSRNGNGTTKVNGNIYSLPWSGEFPSGTNIQIEAMPDNGWSFTNWSGDFTGSINPTSLSMNGNKSITVNFSQNCDYSLTININPPGSGTVAKNPDKANYCLNEQVQLAVNPNEGYNFSSWGGVDSSNGLTSSVTMNANRTVKANFSQKGANEPEIDVTPVFYDFGAITIGQSSSPQGITISNMGSGDLMLGTLSITGEGAWVFRMQNDNCTGNTLKQSESCTVELILTPVTTGSFHENLVIPSNDSDETMLTVVLKGGSGADLTGGWLTLVKPCKNHKKGIKCKIKGKLNIQNTGNQNALSSYVRFHLSDNNVYDEGDILLKQRLTGKIKTGKSTNRSFSYSFSYGETASGKYVIAVIDADNKVAEMHEDNNNIIYGPLP